MWLHFSPFLSALLLAARIYQFTQQRIHFKPPNLLLPLRPTVQPQNQNHRTSNRTPSTHQRYHAFHGSTVAPSSPHNTHSQPNSAHTHPLRTSQSTFPSLVNPHQRPKHISRHTHASTCLYRVIPVHTLNCLPAESHGHACQHKATSTPLSAKYPSTRPTRGLTSFQFCSFSKDSADGRGKECGLAGCRTARGRCPSLQ